MKSLTIAIFVVWLSSAPAQESRQTPSFEVASVRPTDSRKGYEASRVHNDGGRISFESISLQLLLIRAFDIQAYQIHGPSWLTEDRFDVVAKLPENASNQQVPAMLQSLLEERFGLRFHWDIRIEPGFALLVGKGGSRLTKSSDASAPTITGPMGTRVPGSMRATGYGHLEFSAFTMERFAKALSGNLGRPVVDLTEVPGEFDIVLNVDPASMPGHEFFQSWPVETRPTLAIAIESLGLKLEARKLPGKHLVIDKISRSVTEN